MFGRLDELKGRVKELEQQLQETSQEVRVWAAPKWALGSGGGRSGRADTAVSPQAEMERALLQGERESEVARLQQEQEVVQQLQEKLSSLDASIRKERDKVSPEAGLSPWGCDMLSPAPVPTYRADAGGVLPCSPGERRWGLRRHSVTAAVSAPWGLPRCLRVQWEHQCLCTEGGRRVGE